MPFTKLHILPCAYLAPVQYYAHLLQKNCIIEINDYFVKQSIRSRCQIYGANGRLTLIVPKIRKKSSKTLFKDLKINYDHNWQKEHWQSIMSAYRSSPFFEYYEDELKPLFFKKHLFLFDLNIEMMSFICSKMGLSTSFTFSQHYNKNFEGIDLRNEEFNKKEIIPYIQVFENKHGFLTNLSILDLLFNYGNQSKSYLKRLTL